MNQRESLERVFQENKSLYLFFNYCLGFGFFSRSQIQVWKRRQMTIAQGPESKAVS